MFKEIAYKIRHLPFLVKANWLWDLVRKPYHQFLNRTNKGVEVVYEEAKFQIAIPPEYYNINIANYEKIATLKLINWIKNNPNCLVIDIGCANGLISTICLFASLECEVIAIDSDIESLAATLKMCNYAANKKLKIVNCLISDTFSDKKTIDELNELTIKTIKKNNILGLPNATKYINLDKNIDNKIPLYSIDHLFNNYTHGYLKVLIKCDIEGAELFALKGAQEFIKACNPVILLSVHPEILFSFNYSHNEITEFLSQINYKYEVIAIDHEEHWWCEPVI